MVLDILRTTSWFPAISLLLCVTCLEEAARAESTQTTFLLTNASTLLPYLPQRLLDPGWSDIQDLPSCYFKTISNYNYAKGFLHNANTKVCTPIFWITGPGGVGAKEVKDEDGSLYLDKDAGLCKNGFELYDVSTNGTNGTQTCIKYSNSLETYQDATTICNDWGGHLATVKTFAKLELLRTLATYQEFWIGLDDIAQENSFIWQVDGEALNRTSDEQMSLFNPYEPNGYDATEDCIEFDLSTGKLNDIPCYLTHGYVCEILML